MKMNIKKQKLSKSISLIQPTCPILCTTKNEDDSDHIAPFSWFIPVSRRPPRVALALLNEPRKQHSLVNIERTDEFVINIPDTSLTEKVLECAIPSGLEENKFHRSGFTKLPSKHISVNGIEECKASLECKVYALHDVGDHKLIIADVVNCQYDIDSYNEDLTPNYDIFTPIIYLSMVNRDGRQMHSIIRSMDIQNIQL